MSGGSWSGGDVGAGGGVCGGRVGGGLSYAVPLVMVAATAVWLMVRRWLELVKRCCRVCRWHGFWGHCGRWGRCDGW